MPSITDRFPHLTRRPEALAPLGWTGRDAEWITLVCLHSGVFVRAQFCHAYGCSPQTAMRFDRRLTDEGIAGESALPGSRTNQKLCHIHARPLYRTLGIEDLRHRRRPGDAVLWRRLLSLDAVLESPDLAWLPTEQDKVRYFTDLRIDPDLLPRRVYTGRGGITTRYFAWKLPIAGHSTRATFVYADPGLDTTRQLGRWCAEHEDLWAALRAAGLQVHVHAVARTRAADQRNATFLARHHTTAPPARTLSPEEARTLDRIEAALLANDQAVLQNWGGFMDAARTASPLRERADALVRGRAAYIDRVQTHVASRVADDVFAV